MGRTHRKNGVFNIAVPLRWKWAGHTARMDNTLATFKFDSSGHHGEGKVMIKRPKTKMESRDCRMRNNSDEGRRHKIINIRIFCGGHLPG